MIPNDIQWPSKAHVNLTPEPHHPSNFTHHSSNINPHPSNANFIHHPSNVTHHPSNVTHHLSNPTHHPSVLISPQSYPNTQKFGGENYHLGESKSNTQHQQILLPNNLSTHMMAVKVSWYKAARSSIEILSGLFLSMGSIIFLIGFLKLLWASSPLTCIQSGSIMIGSFLTIGVSSLGFIGCYQENWCLVTSYAISQLCLFVFRTIVIMVLIKINFSSVQSFDSSFKTTKPFSDLPYLITGLPGTSIITLELLYCIIEISLSICAFYVSYALDKAEKEHAHHERELYLLSHQGDSYNQDQETNNNSNLTNHNLEMPKIQNPAFPPNSSFPPNPSFPPNSSFPPNATFPPNYNYTDQGLTNCRQVHLFPNYDYCDSPSHSCAI